MAPRSQKYMLAASAVSAFGSSLTQLCFIVLASQADSVQGVTWVIIASYTGLTLAGPLNGLLAKYLEPLNLLRACEALSIAILWFVILSKPESITILASLIFCLSLAEGVFHPNRYGYINSAIADLKEKNNFLSKLQSVDNSLSILGPVTGGLILYFTSVQICFTIDTISFALSLLYWIKQGESQQSQSKHRHTRVLDGYFVIIGSRPLLLMNIARILGNYVFIVWSIALPWILLKMAGATRFAVYQGLCLGVMAFGLFLTNILTARIQPKNNESDRESWLLWTALVSGTIGISLLLMQILNGIHWPIVIIAALFFGASNAGFRTGGILIGMRITPKDKLPLTISAADSIVRPVSALMAFLVGALIEVAGVNATTVLAYMIVCGTLLLGSSVFLYMGARRDNSLPYTPRINE
jgi:hypothetical protein